MESLALQYKDDFELEVVFVDFINDTRQNIYFDFIKPATYAFWNHKNYTIRNVSPLPSSIQGVHKKTSIDWFSAGNARNTGFIHSRFDYVVFCDDLTVLMPGWLDAVIQAANENYCVLGTYEKRNKLVVENGELISSEDVPNGKDSRLQFAPYERTGMRGGSFYGCSFGIPIEYALKLNGFDLICDCIGTEDTQFGIRLQQAGCPMYLDKRMFTIESDELHFVEGNSFRRESFPCTKEQYFERLQEFGINERPEREDFKYDAPWFINDLAKYKPQIESYKKPYSLRALRDKVLAGGTITVEDMNLPSQFWWTGQPITEL